MTKVAINGLGRIGKLALKSLIEHGMDGDVVLLNDPVGTAEQHAMWLEFDTVHGRWPAVFAHSDNGLSINGHTMRLTHENKPSDLPLRELGIDIAIDCSGIFKRPPSVQPYFDAGVTKVIVSTPVKLSPALNLVYGVNHDVYDADEHHLITAASSTVNCLAPIVKVLHEELEIIHGSITTIHNTTNQQTLVDRPARDSRHARSALNSLIPTADDTAGEIGRIFPDLDGLLHGHAIRVPVLNGSLTDCVFEVAHETTAQEVNALFQEYSAGPLRGIMGFEERKLVSADYLNDPRSSIIDAASTMVIDETQVKVLAWYDNEWAYACRLADIARMVASGL